MPKRNTKKERRKALYAWIKKYMPDEYRKFMKRKDEEGREPKSIKITFDWYGEDYQGTNT